MIILQLYNSERNKLQSIRKYSHKLRSGTMQVTVFTAFVGRCVDSGRSALTNHAKRTASRRDGGRGNFNDHFTVI